MKSIAPTPKRTVAVIILFLLSAAFYFSPIAFPCKICIPVGILAIAALLSLPFPFFMALAFSALGDYFGAIHNFPAQMGAFAIGHLSFIIYFLNQKRHHSAGISSKSQYAGIITYLTLLLYVLVSIFILPHVSDIYLRMGVAVYALLILFMLRCALTMKVFLFRIGAILFVFSDSILAWNKFVSHIPDAWLFIMIPYYLGQLLLFCGAIRNRMKFR